MELSAIAIVAAMWLFCAALSFGMINAYFSGKYPRVETGRDDIGEYIVVSVLFGPLGTVLFYFLSGFCEYGMKFNRATEKA